jgi:hypothetical protein
VSTSANLDLGRAAAIVAARRAGWRELGFVADELTWMDDDAAWPAPLLLDRASADVSGCTSPTTNSTCCARAVPHCVTPSPSGRCEPESRAQQDRLLFFLGRGALFQL